jgi:hypothetical protein
MKGAPKVIEELNKALREELTAIKKNFPARGNVRKLELRKAFGLHQKAVDWREAARRSIEWNGFCFWTARAP